ncbi:MAG: replicative DNA helicase, partial [Deltaproteobacteria bacterium]
MAGEVPLHKVPPQSLESEQSVLGGIIIDNEAFHKVAEFLRPEDFYKEAHQKIYEAMLSLYERGEPLDLITIVNELKKNKVLEKVGGASYLAQLAEVVPTAANILHYARIVKEKALLRQLISAATEIVTECYREEEDIEELLDRAERLIFSISEFRVRPSFYPMKEVLKDTFKVIERLYERKELVTGVPSGFKDLDRLTAGFQPSDLIIVAGRPSMGKTAFCLNIAQYAAIHAKIPTAIFSMEMSKEQVAMRMLCSEARVSASKVRSGFITETDLQRLTMAASVLSDAPIVVD